MEGTVPRINRPLRGPICGRSVIKNTGEDMKNLAIIFMILLFQAQVVFAVSINEKNWMTHKSIKEVRKIYKEIKDGINNKEYKYIKRKFEQYDCGGTYSLLFDEVAYDRKGRVRYYSHHRSFSDGAVIMTEWYYDANGILRFVFVKKGSDKDRIYLNGKGEEIWTVSELFGKASYYDGEAHPHNMPYRNTDHLSNIDFSTKKCTGYNAAY